MGSTSELTSWAHTVSGKAIFFFDLNDCEFGKTMLQRVREQEPVTSYLTERSPSPSFLLSGGALLSPKAAASGRSSGEAATSGRRSGAARAATNQGFGGEGTNSYGRTIPSPPPNLLPSYDQDDLYQRPYVGMWTVKSD